jgi:hypothetical protein
MQKEYKIGEKFKYAGVELEVCREQPEGDCVGCYFEFMGYRDCRGEIWCSGNIRVDKQWVIFKEVKGDKMKKPIFENEEEANEFLKEVAGLSGEVRQLLVENVKEHGYIKQSDLMKAKSNWYYWAGSSRYSNAEGVELAIIYIKELEKELKELGKESAKKETLCDSCARSIIKEPLPLPDGGTNVYYCQENLDKDGGCEYYIPKVDDSALWCDSCFRKHGCKRVPSKGVCTDYY